MQNTLKMILAGIAGLVFTTGVLAQPTILSDMFTGSDPNVRQIINHGDFCSNSQYIYREVGPFQVDTTGTYQISDVGWYVAVDTVTTWHEGPFDPQDRTGNLVGGVDDSGSVNLQAGKEYYVVAQPWCTAFQEIRAVWAISIEGPGTLDGPQLYDPPAFMMGDFDGSEDLTDTLDPELSEAEGCVDSFYDLSGPHQVEQSGPYFVAPYSGHYGPFLQVAIYDQDFDPDNPQDNKISDVFPLMLEADTDYWFVTQPACQPDTGPWAYALFPSVPFAFNGGASGAYYDLMTPGQGEFMEVYPDIRLVFLAMFTWTTDAPPANGESALQGTTTQTVGDSRQRWLTMQGFYEEEAGTVELDVNNSTGGVFNDPAPVDTVKVGTAMLEMDSCTSGKLTYDLDTGEQGMTMLNRIADDNALDCVFRYLRPDVLYDEE